MRPRSRRLRAQRKFPQNAAPPPSAAPAPPAPPANGDRRDNNPEERGNYIIQHQVGPSEFVDYISHQALDSHHHQDFQPRVLLRRLRVPSSTNANTSTTTRTRTRRAELARNRELARSRVTDKNKEQDDKCAETSKNKETKSTETATNKDASKNKDGHKSKAVTFSKDIAKNTSNAKSNHANKETAKSKELVSDKEVKKKDAAKNKSSDKKQENVKNKKSNLHQEKSNTDNPPLSQKHKPTKPVHVMSLRSRRQSKHEFKKKKATKRVTTRLATAKRNIARALEVSTKSEKKMQDASKSTRRHTPKPSSEFSLDDNRPLTYFKNSTPKRAPTATVPRVSLVPLSAATTEPVPGPSGINKKKTNARNQKTKDNLDSSLANITTEPLPSVVTDTVSDSNVARPFYSEPNIYRWMNSSLDDEQSATTSKSNLAPWVSAETQCPALQWRTIKDLNNAEKPELEARCCKCEACNRITKLMRISENLKSHMFLVSGEGDNTPEANKHDDNISSVSTDTTIYLETIPKTPSSVMKIQAHKIHGKKLLSSCVISRTQARQTTDISLLELEMLLDQLNETLSASSQAGESAGGVVMESSYETDSSTSDPLLQPRPTFNTKRLRRQSVCPDQATEGRLTRQRRNSKGAQLALENKAKRLRHISEKASEEHMTRRRRESVWVEQTKEDRPKRQRRLSQRSEPALQDKPRRQRRATVCAEKTTEEQPEVQRLSSECAEVATEGRPTRQRRSSQGAQPALQIKTRRQRRFSEKVTEEHVKRPRQEPVPVEQEPVPVEQEPVPVEQITENRPKRQRRLSQRAELALQDNPKRKRRVSVCAEKLKPKSADSVDLALQDKSRLAAEKPKRRRRDSVCAALALQDNPRLATEEHPKRQRRDSVCAALALQDNPRLATEEHPKRQRRDSVCAALALQDNPRLATEEHPKRQRRDSVCAALALQDNPRLATEEHPKRQRRDSVCAALALQDNPRLATEEHPKRQRRDSVCAALALQDNPRLATEEHPKRQRRDSVCAALALQDNPRLATEEHPKRQRRDSVCAALALQDNPRLATEEHPKRQRRDSVCAALALQDNPRLATEEHPKRQRRDSVCAALALQDNPRLATEEHPKRQRRDSVCAALALQDNPRLATEEHPKRQRRDSVCAALALQDNPRLATEEHPKRQRRDSVCAALALQDNPRLATPEQPTRQEPDSGSPALNLQQQRLRRRRASIWAALIDPDAATEQDRDSVSPAQEQPRQQRRDSTGAELEEPTLRDRDSLSPVLDVPEQTTRRRRQSVCSVLGLQEQPALQSLDTVYSELTRQERPTEPLPNTDFDDLALQEQPTEPLLDTDFDDLALQEPPSEQPLDTIHGNLTQQAHHQQSTQNTLDYVQALLVHHQQSTQQSTQQTTSHESPRLTSEDQDDSQTAMLLESFRSRGMLCDDEPSVSAKSVPTTAKAAQTSFKNISSQQQREQTLHNQRTRALSVCRPREDVESPSSSRSSFELVYDASPVVTPALMNPAESTPDETTAADVTPAETTSAETTSAGTTPAETAPAETTSAEDEARMMAEVDAQAKALETERDAKGDDSQDQDMGHSSSSDPKPSCFPSSADSARILEAPVFRPTKDEFDEPIKYFDKVLFIAIKYGICKVLPPDGWQPKCKINEEIRFDVSNQYISRLYSRWGPASRELSALKLCLQLQNVNVTRPPLVDGVEVNLPKLYHLVQRYGGLENVINKKRWGKVAEEMRFNKGPVIERKLDQIYVKYLLPYATLDHHERQEIMKKVEVAWSRKNQKLHDRALNPLHRQKQMLGECDSSDGETEDERTADALADAEDCVVSGQCMNFAKFKKVATNAYETYIGVEKPGAPSPSASSVEDQYWRIVVQGTEHLCVNSAAIDTGEEGHGFTKNKNEAYGRHPWNLKNFSSNPHNLLRYLGPRLGVTVPTLHLGMIFSTSCWHKDPHMLPWTEYLHSGKSRIWYGIPDGQSDNFRKAVETLAPTSCQNKSLWLPSDIAMIPPNLLRDHNVSLARTVQEPGEFVIVFPKAYSCSISTGYAESESVYFASRSWVQNLSQVLKETRESCEPTMFSIEELLVRICADPETDIELLKLVKKDLESVITEELYYRDQLYHRGLEYIKEFGPVPSTSKGRGKRHVPVNNDRELDECDYCRAKLYFSKLCGITGRDSQVCLEHACMLLESNKYKNTPLEQLQLKILVDPHVLHAALFNCQSRVRNSAESSPEGAGEP